MMIGHMLRLWLEQYNLDVTTFASLSGYDRKVVHNWLSRRSIPNKQSIRNIVDTLAHFAHWTTNHREYVFVKLLGFRETEMSWQMRLRQIEKNTI